MTQEHHARFSPSKLSRILTCTSSILLEEKALQDDLIQAEQQSSYAAEGTRKHELIAEALLAFKQGDLINIKDSDVQECFDYVAMQLTINNQLEIYGIELPVSLEDNGSTSIKDVYGTVDCVLYDDTDFIVHIIDWKFGYNRVDVKNNQQLLAYTAGVYEHVLKHTDVMKCKFKLHIVQPAIEHYDSIEINTQQLNTWMNTTRDTLKQIQYGNTSFNPSTGTCKWCRVAAICEANHAYNTVIAEQIFAAYTAISKGDIVQPEVFNDILDKGKQFKDYLTTIHDYIQEQLIIKGSFPGYKLVAGKTMRKWINEDLVSDWIEESGIIEAVDIYEVKMKSPAKLEKLYKPYKKDKDFIALYTKHNKPVVVNADDKRPEYTAATVFKEYKKTIK